jgi:hypothetical protein
VGANLSARGNPFVDEHDVAPAYSAKRSLADAEEDFYRRNSSFCRAIEVALSNGDGPGWKHF